MLTRNKQKLNDFLKLIASAALEKQSNDPLTFMPAVKANAKEFFVDTASTNPWPSEEVEHSAQQPSMLPIGDSQGIHHHHDNLASPSMINFD